MTGNTVRNVRIGLGGIAYQPWRSHEAEAALTGQVLSEETAAAAAKAALQNAQTQPLNEFKVSLARQTLVRALMQARSMTVAEDA